MMKKIFLCSSAVFAFLLLVGGIGYAEYYDLTPRSISRTAYLQQLGPHSVIIRFRARADLGDTPWVEIHDQGNTKISSGESWPAADGRSLEHRVTILDLEPASEYSYRYGLENGPSWDGGSIRTAPLAGSSQTPSLAWVVGDAGIGNRAQRRVLAAALEQAGETPELVLFTGDLAYRKGLDHQFTRRLLRPYSELFASACLWPAPGNHDLMSSDPEAETGPYYETVELPTKAELGGLASGTENYFSFDHGEAHIVVIDSSSELMDDGEAMLDWLARDLEIAEGTWNIALAHHPPYSGSGDDRDDPAGKRIVAMRELVVPILEAGGVDLVLAGHTHQYERSRQVLGGQSIADGPEFRQGEGIVYVVAGHGGQELVDAGRHPLMALHEVTFGSGLLRWNNERLWYENVRIDGTISDRFEIVAVQRPSGDIDG